jgi:predicted adenylyl cyclase CyaB
MRRLLRSLGAPLGRQRRQVDYSFDTPARDLARQNMLIRLRKDGAKTLLTFKGPVLAGKFKRRFEYNAEVSDFARAKRLLRQSGLLPFFLKEKLRQETRFGRAVICLDTLPFLGAFIEIEGSDAVIGSVIASLKLNPASAIKDTYNGLFLKFLRRHPASGRKVLMRFADQKKIS